MTRISNFRVSFIWIETIPAILAQEVAPDAPGAFFGRVGKYAQAIDRSQAHQAPAGFALPWLKPQGNHYWRHSFAGQQAGDVIGATAWRHWVPLRRELAGPIRAQGGQPTKITFEAYCAPPGIAIVANAYYRGVPRAPLDIAAMAQAVRYTRLFATDIGQPFPGRLLQPAADFALDALRHAVFGDVPAYAGHNQPFSIATIVQGDQIDPNAAMTEGSPEHRLLDAVTGWYDRYQMVPPAAGSLTASRLLARTRAAGDVVYAQKSGRAIWLPREFLGAPAAPRLACYHRNLVMASVQTLLLGEFVDWIAKTHKAGQAVKPLLMERAKQAAGLLETSAAGDPTVTYRSKSIDALATAAAWPASIAYLKQL